jgi:hypothetical protein
VGGVASATVLGALLAPITPFNAWQSALVALAICVMGFLGGLVMSAIKRDRGVKDWGTLIEGHGGMLDRLDSMVFAAPVLLSHPALTGGRLEVGWVGFGYFHSTTEMQSQMFDCKTGSCSPRKKTQFAINYGAACARFTGAAG